VLPWAVNTFEVNARIVKVYTEFIFTLRTFMKNAMNLITRESKIIYTTFTVINHIQVFTVSID
jgi:hypothetical protein